MATHMLASTPMHAQITGEKTMLLAGIHKKVVKAFLLAPCKTLGRGEGKGCRVYRRKGSEGMAVLSWCAASCLL